MDKAILEVGDGKYTREFHFFTPKGSNKIFPSESQIKQAYNIAGKSNSKDVNIVCIVG